MYIRLVREEVDHERRYDISSFATSELGCADVGRWIRSVTCGDLAKLEVALLWDGVRRLRKESLTDVGGLVDRFGDFG